MNRVEEYLAGNAENALADLEAFCRIPSVSADPAYAEGIDRAARWVADRMVRAGFDAVERIETGGHPAVLGEVGTDPRLPTVVVYGHYDVQPPDPLEKWNTPPFEPTIRDDRLYARGVSDDKGPLLIPILVAEAYLKSVGSLPVNLKVLIEGEEESGSPHFEPTVARLKDRLSCDLVVSADCAMWRPDRPSITVAMRGLLALDVTVTAAAKDLHSGRHGGSAPNPIRALARMLATLHDDDGRVVVDGFMEGAIAPDPAIIAAIEAANFDAAAYFDQIGAPHPEPLPGGAELLTRQWLEPTLEFNGIFGGYADRARRPSFHPRRPQRSPAVSSPDRARMPPLPRSSGISQNACLRDIASRSSPRAGQLSLLGRPGSPGAFGGRGYPGGNVRHAAVARRHGRDAADRHLVRPSARGGPVFFSFSTSDEDYHAPNEFFRLANFRAGQIAWARLLHRLGPSER